MPTLLQQIIEEASSDETSVATLLRKVKVVAARLHTVALDKWVEHELIGYSDEIELPSYRAKHHVEVRGQFGGMLGSGVENGLIPEGMFPEGYRNGPLFTVAYREPISHIERFAASKENVLKGVWPADAVVRVNMLLQNGEVELYPDMFLQSAHYLIPVTRFIGIVDAVRTRVLDLALGLEPIAPNAGEPGAASPSESAVAGVVLQVLGGSPNITFGDGPVIQSVENIVLGDRDALRAALRDLGVQPARIAELDQAIDADAAAGEGAPGKGIGPRVQQWLRQAAISAPAAAAKGAAGAAGGLVAKAIAAHYGLGS